MRAGRAEDRRSIVPLLLVTMTATFMGIADNFIVSVAVPSIRTDLSTDVSGVQSIVAVYALVYGILLVPSARLGDRCGYRALFVVGVGIFTVASLLCGLAPNLATLIIARGVQAAGAAAFYPQVLTLLQQHTDGRERGTAFATLGFTLGLASISGQILGGVLVEGNVWELGWRTIFLVNVALGPLVVLAALVVLPAARKSEKATREAMRLDTSGSVLLAGSLAVVLIPLLFAEPWGWPIWLATPLLAGAALGSTFWHHQQAKTRQRRSPLIDTRLLGRGGFRHGLVMCGTFFAGTSGLLFVLPLHLQTVEGATPLESGLAFLPLAVCFTAASSIGPRLRSVAPPLILSVGYGINLFGVLGLLSLAAATDGGLPDTGRTVTLALIGVGMGMGLTPLAGEVLAHVPPGAESTASGVLETCIQVASAFGVATIGLAYSIFDAADPSPVEPGARQAPFVAALALHAVLLVVTLFTARRLVVTHKSLEARVGGHER